MPKSCGQVMNREKSYNHNIQSGQGLEALQGKHFRPHTNGASVNRNLVYKFNHVGGHWFCRKDWLNCDNDNGEKTRRGERARWIRFWGRWVRLFKNFKVRINFDCFLCEESEGILRVKRREEYCTDLWFQHILKAKSWVFFFPGVEQRRKRVWNPR